jgi:transposase
LVDFAESNTIKLSSPIVPSRPVRDKKWLSHARACQCWQGSKPQAFKRFSVAANELGVTGRNLLSALIAGTSNADELANWRANGCAASCQPLRQALTGRFRPNHAFLVG